MTIYNLLNSHFRKALFITGFLFFSTYSYCQYMYNGSGKQVGRLDGNYFYDGSGRQIGRGDGLTQSQITLFFYYYL